MPYLELILLVMTNRKQSVVIPLTLVSLMTAGQAQELAPDDPAIVESLGAWFRDAGGIDEWFNSNLTMNSVLSNAGAQFTTSSGDFFMGDLRGGSTAVPGFGTATSLSEFNISQVIIYNSALTDQQISDINEFMVSENVPEPGSTVLLGLASLGILRRRR